MDIGSSEAFSQLGTLGVEEEFYIVDERGRPTSGIGDLVYGAAPPDLLEDRLDHELFKFTIETQTPLIESVDQVDETMRSARAALVDHAERHG